MALGRHLAIRQERGAPLSVRGRIRTFKTAAAVCLLAIFCVTPLIRWSRPEGMAQQAVLFDIPRQSFFFFDWVFWPQDLPLVVGLLVMAAAGLFTATALFGRLWCGFACPQTVWTDLFFALERRVNSLVRAAGGRRLVLGGVHGLIACATSVTFVAYFTDAMSLAPALIAGSASGAAYVTVIIGALLTYVLAARVRERVCLHMCPWPRFQSALLDDQSWLVTYRRPRGEPRGRARIPLRADLSQSGGSSSPLLGLVQEAEGALMQATRGDCIDCGRCVAVCPTGVDIRDGLQMGCIGCGLCIDACDSVMARLDRPPGLIGFDQANDKIADTPRRGVNLRPKTLVFGLVFFIALGAVITGLVMRRDVFVSVEPSRNPPFVLMSDGAVRNDFIVRLTHRRKDLRAVSLMIDGAPGAKLRSSRDEGQWGEVVKLPVREGALEDRILVLSPRITAPNGRQSVQLIVRDADSGQPLATMNIQLWGPAGS